MEQRDALEQAPVHVQLQLLHQQEGARLDEAELVVLYALVQLLDAAFPHRLHMTPATVNNGPLLDQADSIGMIELLQLKVLPSLMACTSTPDTFVYKPFLGKRYWAHRWCSAHSLMSRYCALLMQNTQDLHCPLPRRNASETSVVSITSIHF